LEENEKVAGYAIWTISFYLGPKVGTDTELGNAKV